MDTEAAEEMVIGAVLGIGIMEQVEEGEDMEQMEVILELITILLQQPSLQAEEVEAMEVKAQMGVFAKEVEEVATA